MEIDALLNLPDWVRVGLAIIIVILLLPLLLGPFLLKVQHRIQRNIRLRRLDQDVPESMAQQVQSSRLAYEAAGFKWVGYYVISEMAPLTMSWISLFRHTEQRGLAAMTAGMFQLVPNAEPRLAFCYDEVSGLYAEDFGLCVSNSPMPGAFDLEHKLMLRFPQSDPAELVRLYAHIAAQHPRCQTYVAVPAGQEADYVSQALRRDFDEQVKLGLYFVDSRENIYRLTWVGAVVMTMRHVFPFAQLRVWAELRRARKWRRGAVFKRTG
ncbi:MAG: hypothetical protein ACO1RX_08500 [Candidatus Sericytochromatia bacterium]